MKFEISDNIGRRFRKSSLGIRNELVSEIKEDKKLYNLDKNDKKEVIKEDKNEFLDFFNKFKTQKMSSQEDKDKMLGKNRKATCFSELEILGSKPKNVSKLTTFFEEKGRMNLNKTEKNTPKERRKKVQRKLVPLEGQMKIDMFLEKENMNGPLTPNSGKRKLIDEKYDFSSLNTPEKKRKIKILGGNIQRKPGV